MRLRWSATLPRQGEVHVEELTAAGRDAAAERAMLRQAEDRLGRLRESRAVLVTGELLRSGDEDE